jgi:peptide/nickel transport system permease protein
MILLRRTGDPPSASDIRDLRAELGLDRPLVVRYGQWMWDAMHGDLGNSYRSGKPVSEELASRVSASLRLSVVALAIGIALAVPFALLSAVRSGSATDHATRVVALAGISTPGYLLAYLLILLFGAQLHWFPVSGSSTPRHLVLPALTLGIIAASGFSRLLRASLLDELHAPYVQAVRARGVSEARTVTRHVLRNALNPLVTVSALRFGRLLGEGAIVETVFGWPGIGLWMVASIRERDYPAIQGFVVFMAALFTVIHLVVEVVYAMLDPRVRSPRSADVRP